MQKSSPPGETRPTRTIRASRRKGSVGARVPDAHRGPLDVERNSQFTGRLLKRRQPVLGRQLLQRSHTTQGRHGTTAHPRRIQGAAETAHATHVLSRQRRSSGSTRAALTCARRYPRDERRQPTRRKQRAPRTSAGGRNAARDDVTTRLTTGAAAARGLSGRCHCSHQGRGGGTPGRPRAAPKTPGPGRGRGRLATEPRKCACAHRPPTCEFS